MEYQEQSLGVTDLQPDPGRHFILNYTPVKN